MKFCFLLVISIIIVRTLTSCSKTPSTDPKDQHVILISLDGFPAWLWNDESLQIPNLRKLAAEAKSAPRSASPPDEKNPRS